jgi:NADH-quinone oxidoreductase subunit C
VGASSPQPAIERRSGLSQEAIADKLRARFGDRVLAVVARAGQHFAVVGRADLLEILAFLRDEPGLDFECLVDVTAVDHRHLAQPEIRERFAVVYQLSSLSRGHRFRIKTTASESEPRVPSACGLWRSALWGERETHDMFGIEFDGNPDLRRLLMPANYVGFPLRKDYPLRGRGERESFLQVRRTTS